MQDRLPGPRLPTWLQTACYGFRPVPYLQWCQRRYGDTFAVRLPGHSTAVVLADPDAIKEVMALDAEDFNAAASAPYLEPFLGSRSLLLLDGGRHKAERKLLVQGLHGGAMSEYAQQIADATRRDMTTWPSGRAFALHPHLQTITLDVIVRLIVGADDEEGHDELISLLGPWIRQDARSVILLWEPLRRDLRGHGPWASFVAQRKLVHDWLDRHIARRRQDPNLASRTDVLSMLLALGGLDDVSLRDQLITMLLAGHDTSATALAWAFTLILRHPAVLDRLIAGVDAGEERYLEAVVKEVLRLTPVVLETGRTLTRDRTIGGIRLPAGVAAAPSIFLVQRRADCYPEPQSFRPERFLDSAVDHHTWMPFGGGIRRCIGAAFATLEIKTVLASVLGALELEAVGPMEKPRRRAVTMIPSRGARVRLIGTREHRERRGKPRSKAVAVS
ncbi:MAG TPA: cytochrome P450 [Acidimicrobiales bacterium]|nr:cytochrome P450 [Acidimicrobiales bacterium]